MKKIFLENIEEHKICSIGEKIKNKYQDDLKFIRTTLCKNSYVEVLSDKGSEIIEMLIKEITN